jgi:hypothetical protein
MNNSAPPDLSNPLYGASIRTGSRASALKNTFSRKSFSDAQNQSSGGEKTMRTALLGFAALAAALAIDAGPAAAQVYPWCANYGGRGGTNCYFANLWQCRQAVSGTGGYCTRNPFYGAYPRVTSRYWYGY